MPGQFVFYLLLFAVSLFVLIKGSDWFIISSEKIGIRLGISPFIIGVTIVAFGTSMPELATSIAAVSRGDSAIVAGNVVGSNITNILLVLGLVAILQKKLDLRYNIMDIEIPLLIASAFFLWYALSDGHLEWFEAVLFLVALFLFLVNALTMDEDKKKEHIKLNAKIFLMFFAGGGMIYFGAEYTIVALGKMAEHVGVGSDLIALSMVALGTSLPEVAVSLTAAKKSNLEMAVGNIIGSNIFNTYAVMALPSFLGTLEITPLVSNFALPLMVGITVLFAIICISRQISKWEGSMLLILYLYYVLELFDQAIG